MSYTIVVAKFLAAGWKIKEIRNDGISLTKSLANGGENSVIINEIINGQGKLRLVMQNTVDTAYFNSELTTSLQVVVNTRTGLEESPESLTEEKFNPEALESVLNAG